VVLAYTGWQKYGAQKGATVRRLDPGRAPVTTALGVLGMPGFTAYAGLTQIGRPKAGETVVVAAASGLVDATVGQLAKILGARAVGIAGGPEKVAYLREIGFDEAIDHRAGDFKDQFAAAAPDGIDVYFENVGGHVWDTVLPRLNPFARVPVWAHRDVQRARAATRAGPHARAHVGDPGQEPDHPRVHPDRVRRRPDG
jgi:hypothetical protein